MIAERLEWEFETAPAREQIRLRNKGREGAPVLHPFERDMFSRAPSYDEVVESVLVALRELGSCRPRYSIIAFTPAGAVSQIEHGEIPITAVWEYVARKGYRGAAAEIMTSGVLEADRVFLAKRNSHEQ